MKVKRPSIKDIASKLDVSVTTVSFVLNGKAEEYRISDKVKHKILSYSKEIGYKPNQLAQSLRTGKSKIIVFMVQDISNLFFAKIARLLEDLAIKQGYKVLFCSNENNDKRSLELIDLFNERGVDGFIITPSPGIQKKIKELQEQEIPIVLFDRYFPDLKTSFVIIDNLQASYIATKHLIENDYKNIAFITTNVKQTQILDRLNGYKKAVNENNLTQKILQIPFAGRSPISTQKKLGFFFAENQDIDSVFFATNYLTKAGLIVLKENFPNLINKWGLLTFDENEYFNIHNPSISSMSQPLKDIAKNLINVMMSLLNGKNKKSTSEIILKAKLIKKDSTIKKSLR